MRALATLASCALASCAVSLTACNVMLGIEAPGSGNADPRITMSATPGSTAQLFPFEIVVVNDARDDLVDGQVTVQLPSGALFSGSSPGCDLSGTTGQCSVPVVQGGETQRFPLTAVPGATGTISARLSVADDLDLSNNGAVLAMQASGIDVEVRPLLDGITSVVGADRLKAYTFRVRSNGPGLAQQVTINIRTSQGFAPIGLSGSGWSCGTSTCTLPELLTNAYSLQWVGRTPADAGPCFVEGTVSSSAPDFMLANNTTRYEQTVTTAADLGIALGATPDPVAAGAALTYTLAVRNNGPSAVAAATVIDTLPAETTFVSATGAGWSCTLAGNKVTCQRVSYLDVGDAPITIAVTAPAAAGAITNTATVSAANLDATSADNSATLTTTVQ